MKTESIKAKAFMKIRLCVLIVAIVLSTLSAASPAAASSSDKAAVRNTVTKFMKASKGKSYKKLNACCSTKLFGPGYGSKNTYMNKYRLNANKKIKYTIKTVKQSGKTGLVKLKVTYKSAYSAYYNECLKLLNGDTKLLSGSLINSFEQYMKAHPGKKKTKTFKLYLKKNKGKWKIDTTDSINVRAIGNFMYCDLSSAVTAAYRDSRESSLFESVSDW